MKYFLIFCLLCLPIEAQAKQSFDAWLNDFKKTAEKRGISKSTVTLALSNLSPNEKVVELDRNQPSSKWTFAKYKEKVCKN